MYSAKILADSISVSGHRLTTMEVTYPRMVHSELMTHRVFSRNAGSSRAIPAKTMIKRVLKNPFVPTYWGKNQAGMQAPEELTGWRRWTVRTLWFTALYLCAFIAWLLASIGLHKQLANRILEPFSWITVIITATEWDNFFNQRCHPDAQPEIRTIAEMMQYQYRQHQPRLLHAHEWHTPLLPDEDDLLKVYDHDDLLFISTARCARVSFLTHDGKRDPVEDLKLYEKLITHNPVHWSPFEHVARPMPGRHGNLNGWCSIRTKLGG